MKLFKRVVVAAMAATLAATTLVACSSGSGNGGSGNNSSDETVTLQVYSQLANYQGMQTGWFATLLKEKFNVELNIIQETDGSAYSTRMEAKDLGDIVIWGADGEQYQNAYKAGLLYDWYDDDLLQNYGPYIYANMQAALQHNADISDGVTYGFGHNVATNPEDHEQFFYSWDLRYDLYEQIGKPEIKNLDDLTEVFKKMQEVCPTDDNGNPTYAVSLWPDWDGNMVMYVKSTATAYYGYDELGIGLYNCETGEFYDCLDPDGPYIEMLKWYNELYREGLLDPDSMTQKYDEMAAKVQTGRTFFSIFNYAGSSAYNTQEHIADNKAMYSVCPTEATPIVYGMNVLGGNRIWSIGAKTKYPDKCMEIINWLCTPEGYLTSNYGVRGLCWDYDENNLTYLTALGKKCATDVHTHVVSDDEKYSQYCNQEFGDGNNEMGNTTWSIDAINPETGESYNYKNWKSEETIPAEGSIEADWRAWSNASSSDEYMEKRGEYKVSLASGYSEGSKDPDLKVVWNQVTECILTGTWNAIYAKSDAECDQIIKKMIDDAHAYDNGNGYQECVDWCKNEAATRKAAEDAVINSTKVQ